MAVWEDNSSSDESNEASDDSLLLDGVEQISPR